MSWWSRHRGEQGAVAIVVALVVCFVAIPLAAVAVDLGVQRVARRDMQSLADMAAMDLARQLDGRAKSAYVMSNLTAAANDSITRNSSTVGSAPVLAIKLGTTDPAKYGTSGYFTESASSGIPTAVQVTASTDVSFGLMGGTGAATRTAVAMSKADACFSVGSYAAMVRSGKGSLLGPLLGDALNTTVVGYEGLATASVSLLGLATELGAGSLDQLLDLKDVTLSRLYLASAKALEREGGTTAQVDLLKSLAARVGGLPPVDILEIIALEQGNGAALDAGLNVLNLLATSAFVSNGTNALAIPNLALNLGLANLSSSLTLIEKPRTACGSVGTRTETSQLNLELGGDLLNLPNIGLLKAQASMSLHLELAKAWATLDKVVCGPGTTIGPEGVDVSVASALSQLTLKVPVTLKTLGLPLLKVDVVLTTTKPSQTRTAEIRVLPDTYDTAKPTGSGVALSGLHVQKLNVEVLGILPLPLDLLLGDVVSLIVNPLVQTLDTVLLGPLSNLLGLNLGGADIFLHQPIKPTCNAAKLIG